MQISWISIANYNFSFSLHKQNNNKMKLVTNIVAYTKNIISLFFFKTQLSLKTVLRNIDLKNTKSMNREADFLTKFFNTFIVMHWIYVHQSTVVSFLKCKQCHMRCQQFLLIDWFQQTFENQIPEVATSKYSRNY